MLRAEDQPRERDLDQLLRIVLGLEQRRQPLVAKAFQLGFREGRARDDVGHDRQRVGEPRDRHVQVDVGGVGGAGGRELRAEEVDRVGDLERVARAGPFVEHVGGQARQAELVRGIGGDAGADRQLEVHGRHLVDAR